jgi:methionine biosynthesis protein MetW
MSAPQNKKKRLDYQIIMELIKPESRVLDLGCGDGELLQLLIEKKKCRAVGIELDEQSIYQCIEKGLTVSHADINEELGHYADQKFDYVIINESLQQVIDAEKTLEEALRVGKQVIAGVPNFCFWKARLQIFFKGRVPKTKCLPYEWYNTPNVRFFSLKASAFTAGKKEFTLKKKSPWGSPNGSTSFPIYLLLREFSC